MSPELLYIVDPEDMPVRPGDAYPNFTIPGQDSLVTSAQLTPGGAILSGIGKALPLVALPFGLVTAAVVVSPILAGQFMKAKAEAAAKLEDIQKAELEKFMVNHATTISLAREQGLRFPPGHPQVGIAYKRHPLANVDSQKENVYIPYEKYDAILMEEREAELLKLLVHLGATKIVITRTTSRSEDNSATVQVSANAKAVEGHVSVDTSSKAESRLLDTREFLLSGKHWNEGDKLDTSRFAWVHFEPSWEAMVVARELGGCLKAALEIRENTSFSTNKALSVSVRSLVYGGNVAVDIQSQANEEKVYYVQAEFRAMSTTVSSS